jgi:hypothetical protein
LFQEPKNNLQCACTIVLYICDLDHRLGLSCPWQGNRYLFRNTDTGTIICLPEIISS